MTTDNDDTLGLSAEAAQIAGEAMEQARSLVASGIAQDPAGDPTSTMQRLDAAYESAGSAHQALGLASRVRVGERDNVSTVVNGGSLLWGTGHADVPYPPAPSSQAEGDPHPPDEEDSHSGSGGRQGDRRGPQTDQGARRRR